MAVDDHEMMDGRLHVYKRDGSRFWQCSTYLNGRNHRTSTKEENIVLAKEFARYWYMERYVEARHQRIFKETPLALEIEQARPSLRTTSPVPRAAGKTFRDAAEKFLEEYEVITEGQRSDSYVKSHERRLRMHLLPYFGDKPVRAITAGMVQEFRVHRRKTATDRKGKSKPPTRSTLHHDTVTLRLVLKTAHRHQWIDQVPDVSPPYKTSGKIAHRAWFSKEEYKSLYEATRNRAKNPKRERWRKECEDLHDYVLFMANTGLRPDEAGRLECRDVTVVTHNPTGERILEIEVRGKRGVGYCKSMPGAVLPFERMKKRHGLEPGDRLFGKTPRLLDTVLRELKLKRDRDGNMRTAYSLRHTYICMRLLEGADIYQVAKNCRTSVEMIEKHYAVHLKNTLDASAINVRKARARAAKPEENRAS